MKQQQGSSRRRWLIAALVLAASLAARPASALEPDELLLIVNKNVPDGRKLAERYAGARHVPDGRILELGLPVADDITFEQYEQQVVPGVRRFLEENGLRGTVKCLVTFYGVPLRVTRRGGPGEEEKAELASLQSEIVKTRLAIEPVVVEFEKLAKQVDPGFEARIKASAGLDDAPLRADAAFKAIEPRLADLTDLEKRREAHNTLLKIMEQLVGPNTVTLYLAQRDLSKPDVEPKDRERWERLVDFVRQTRERMRQHLAARYDAAARERVREMARSGFGLIEYAQVVQNQLEYLRPGDTTAAFDNELAMLWWDLYPRAGQVPNPLRHEALRLPMPTTLMTARLDATTVATVDRMLADSIRAEKDGLDGRAVVDTRGIYGGRDAYASFDRELKTLADLVTAKARLNLFLDERADVLPPNSAENVALYTGWYSVGKYVPGCKFAPGAVGYHVASFELGSLHAPAGYWVPNMLNDGAAASLGPVAEPYLTAFPKPQEFFPLLMTGKLTLAEVYWRTTPMVSWMMGLVGDPLYNPFKNKPAMEVSDLPSTSLRAVAGVPVVVLPATRPATGPATRP